MNLLIFVVLLALVVIGLLVRSQPPQDKVSYRVLVDLHAIRRRFDLARFKADVRRDGADARRELRAELERLDKRRRQR
jgi:hypothetical protein